MSEEKTTLLGKKTYVPLWSVVVGAGTLIGFTMWLTTIYNTLAGVKNDVDEINDRVANIEELLISDNQLSKR